MMRLTSLACLVSVGLLSFTSIAPFAAADVTWRTVTAGVEHAQFTRGNAVTSGAAAGAGSGPWVINALRVDLSQVRLDVVHALDEAVGLETVSSIAQRRGAIAAVNGGYFRTTGTFRGDSAGTLQIDRVILSEPDRGRAAVGFVRHDKTTRLVFGHVAWEGLLKARGATRSLDGINRPRGDNEVVVFTPTFHPTTLTDATGTEVVVRGGRVTAVHDQAGSTPIPSDGFVVSTTGTARAWARATLRPRTRVAMSLALKSVDATPGPNVWTTAEDVVGGGPMIVRGGRVDITDKREKMAPTFATTRHPRTAIGSMADGRAVMVVVDGRQPASVGMTLDELAHLMIELGAIEAMNLDGGGSTAMVVQGAVVNHPSDVTGERPVSDAILVQRVP